MHAFSITNVHFITVIKNILTKMLNSNMQYRSTVTTNGKAHIDYYFDVSICCACTQPASLLLCFLCQGGGCWRGCQKVGSVFVSLYLWKHTTILLWKSYKLYPIVPLFVATFRIHADDDNNPLFPYPLHTANSLVNSVIIRCNLQVVL